MNNNPPSANESPLHLVFPSSATRRLSTNNIANITLSSVTLDGAAYIITGSGAGTNVTFDVTVPGALIIGGNSLAQQPHCLVWLQDQIGNDSSNGGVVNSGTLGVLKLAGDLTSTNYLPHYGDIQGRLDLGNSPRSINVWGSSAWLNIHAVISGGPAATLSKGGWEDLNLYAANTYEGLTQINYDSVTIHHPRALGSPNAGIVVADGAS